MKFRKENSSKIYLTQEWDEKIYEALFTSVSEIQMGLGFSFSCHLTKRHRKYCSTHSFILDEYYESTMQLWIDDSQYVDIPIVLTFEKGDDYYDLFINKYDEGYMQFTFQSYMNRPQPSIRVVIRDRSGVSESVAQAYFESKLAKKGGLLFSWSAILNDIYNSSASEVWGTCDTNAENGDLPRGLKPFALSSSSFEVAM
jgi:hypothetical protein